jgi:hypothetical protein
VIDDRLIASMAIDRALPLHESSRRLRNLYPQFPRVYGVAVVADVSARRWWPPEWSTRRYGCCPMIRTSHAPKAIRFATG